MQQDAARTFPFLVRLPWSGRNLGEVCSLPPIAAEWTIGAAEASKQSAVNILLIIVLRKRFEEICGVLVERPDPDVLRWVDACCKPEGARGFYILLFIDS